VVLRINLSFTSTVYSHLSINIPTVFLENPLCCFFHHEFVTVRRHEGAESPSKDDCKKCHRGRNAAVKACIIGDIFQINVLPAEAADEWSRAHHFNPSWVTHSQVTSVSAN
jgi:hypothetical protein